MKKITQLLAALLLGFNLADAKLVEPTTAKQVAENFLWYNARLASANLDLSYTEKTSSGDAAYYVFTMNGKSSGFIIVSAEDAGRAIIGYSTEDQFKAPEAGTGFGWWMENRKKEIEYIRYNNLQPDADAINEWSKYTSNNLKLDPPVSTYTVGALCAAKWGQSGAYNDQCPSNSLTGCVATAMAIIMKKWAYPTTGTGSSSYNSNYGTLTCNYGATTYNWSGMTTPYCSGSNPSVATIMYHCGVSVQMNYSPSASGAYVCGNNPSAQYSYKTYFGYKTTIQCAMQASYTTANWITLLKNEFNAGRPMQYQGVDASAGGHTWVCDGFDASDNMHMNWGWDGSSNGYYAVTNLNAGGFNFTSQLGGLIGIEPMSSAAMDAGISSITTPNGTICSGTFSPVVTLKNFGSNTLTSCVINYRIDSNPNQTYNWNGSLASGATTNITLPSMTTSSGAHTFYSSSSNPNSSTDGNTANDQSSNPFTVSSNANALPLQEPFQASTNLPSGWALANPDNDCAWAVITTMNAYSAPNSGGNCLGFNNCDGNGQTDMTGTKDKFITAAYNFSNASSANMTFDVAYTPCSYNSVVYTDALEVLYSTNCGSTWTSVYNKSGTALATAPTWDLNTQTGCWSPAASEWRNENVNLNALIGQPSVMFAFENISGWGQWLYVDNINITSATAIDEASSDNSFTIYPNPASSVITISGTSQAEKVQYSICNMLGTEIRSGEISSGSGSGNYNAKISVNDISSGMYFIKVVDGDTSITKKLNKQ